MPDSLSTFDFRFKISDSRSAGYLVFHARRHREYVNITGKVEEALRKSGVREGLALVSKFKIPDSR